MARDEEKESPHPFPEESIKEMFRISRGNYRSFILLAHNSIEVALRDNKKSIDEEVLEKAKGLREYETNNNNI